MHLIAFSVHDSKAEAFIQPFFTPTVAVALRAFGSACNDDTQKFCQYPDDYTLFEIGTFDCDTGTFEPLQKIKSHGLALTFMAAPSSLALIEDLQKS